MVLCSKIATNLKVFGSCEGVVEQTLTLFQDLAAGYMSGKLLLKRESISYLLANHAIDDFSFLKDPCNTSNRSTYYFILARLLLMEDNSLKFKAFVGPLQQVIGSADMVQKCTVFLKS